MTPQNASPSLFLVSSFSPNKPLWHKLKQTQETSGSLISPSSEEIALKNNDGTVTKHHSPKRQGKNTCHTKCEHCVHKETNLCKTHFMQELCWFKVCSIFVFHHSNTRKIPTKYEESSVWKEITRNVNFIYKCLFFFNYHHYYDVCEYKEEEWISEGQMNRYESIYINRQFIACPVICAKKNQFAITLLYSYRRSKN